MSCTRGACPLRSPYPVGTTNGLPLLMVNLSTPRMTRRMVFFASGRTAFRPYLSIISAFVANTDGQGRLQSMISAALRHLGSPSAPVLLWVGFGHTMGFPSQRAIM